MPGSEEAVGLRTHPLTGLVQGIQYTVAAIVGLGTSVLSGGWDSLPPGIALLVILGGGPVLGIGIGYLVWWSTRYVIDGTELRINHGVLTRASRRIPYERIQSVDVAEPVLARLFGLAELRIEMAGGSESRSSLRYLDAERTRELRRILLARTHGSTGDDGPDEVRQIITRVPPERVVIGTLLSLDFLAAVAGAVALVVAAIWFGQVVVLLGGVLPVAGWLGRIVLDRVVQQWDFTLSRGEDGLRIERGLLSRTSQSIPFARVQGVAVTEPFVWRRLGWQRLDVDVAGQASRGDDRAQGGSTLLPIADPALAAAVIAELLPGAVPDPLTRVAPPRRSRIFAPVGWRYRWVAADGVAFVAAQGWITRRTSIVPHGKTQSVELRQGPLARRRGLATVEVHTPPGVVDADGRHLDAADARRVALAQLDLARRHR